MPNLRLSVGADLLGVSDDTLRRWIDRGLLRATTDDSGRKVVDGAELAAFAERRWAEQDRPGGSSARNAFTGLVTHVVSDTVMSQVTLQCGPHRVVSLISTEAVAELDLRPGTVATARIKATNVVIDRAAPGGREPS